MPMMKVGKMHANTKIMSIRVILAVRMLETRLIIGLHDEPFLLDLERATPVMLLFTENRKIMK
jgi:hypothetical protein